MTRASDGGEKTPDGEEGIANFVQRGEIRVGGLRMCLFEIISGFYSIRESLERAIGPAASTIFYQAGVKSGRRFVQSAAKMGTIRAGTHGLTDCVEVFSQAGFGSFHITESSWSRPYVRVECLSPLAFEAYAFIENKTLSKVPICDYTRGVLAGFFQQVANRDDIMCLETECRASGARRCVYEIGHQDKLTRMAIGIRTMG